MRTPRVVAVATATRAARPERLYDDGARENPAVPHRRPAAAWVSAVPAHRCAFFFFARLFFFGCPLCFRRFAASIFFVAAICFGVRCPLRFFFAWPFFRFFFVW